MRKILLTLGLMFAIISTVLPPQPAKADLPIVSITGNPLTASTAPYLVLQGLKGQSACSVSISGTISGTYAIEGIYSASQQWTSALIVATPDGASSSSSITSAGSYVFNCANMLAVRLDGSSGGGTPSATLVAGGGINRVVNSGVNGGKTTVAGSSPITVTNAGNTATVGCATCVTATASPVSVIAGSGNVTVATPSPGVFSISVAASSPAPAPVITSGPGAAVDTPSPNNYVVSNTGVLAVTGSGNMASSGGQTPNVTITNAPTFTGTLVSQSAAVGFYNGTATSANHPQAFGVTNDETPTAMNVDFGVDDTQTASTISGKCGVISRYNNTVLSSTALTIDCSGNMGLLGALHAPNLYDTSLTPGDCVQSSTGGVLQSITCGGGSSSQHTAILGNVASGTVTQTVTAPAGATSVTIFAIGGGGGGAGGASGTTPRGGGGGSAGPIPMSPFTYNLAQLNSLYGTTTLVVSILPSGAGGSGGNTSNGSPGGASGTVSITCGGVTIYNLSYVTPQVAGGGASSGIGQGGTQGNTGGLDSTSSSGNGNSTSGGAASWNSPSNGSSSGGGGAGATGTGGAAPGGNCMYISSCVSTLQAANGLSVPMGIAAAGAGGGGGYSASLNGGNGGNYGAGGGGGAGVTSGAAGNGGNGGAGIVSLDYH